MSKNKQVYWFAGLMMVLGLIAVAPAFAATAPTGGAGGWGGGMHSGPMMSGSRMAPGVFGTVTAISGDTLTVTQARRERPNATTTTAAAVTIYTVDATNAKVMKNGTSSTLSAIETGDTVMVQGTMTGTNVAATVIRDGIGGMMGRGGPGGFGGGKGFGHGTSSTPIVSPIQGNGEPVLGGSVTAITGNSLTVTNASNVTYTIDVTNAKIVRNGTTTAVSAIATGDSVVVQGTVSGTSVTATSVIDQGSVSSATSGAGTTPAPGSQPGIFLAIGSFFKHIFGF